MPFENACIQPKSVLESSGFLFPHNRSENILKVDVLEASITIRLSFDSYQNAVELLSESFWPHNLFIASPTPKITICAPHGGLNFSDKPKSFQGHELPTIDTSSVALQMFGACSTWAGGNSFFSFQRFLLGVGEKNGRWRQDKKPFDFYRR